MQTYLLLSTTLDSIESWAFQLPEDMLCTAIRQISKSSQEEEELQEKKSRKEDSVSTKSTLNHLTASWLLTSLLFCMICLYATFHNHLSFLSGVISSFVYTDLFPICDTTTFIFLSRFPNNFPTIASTSSCYCQLVQLHEMVLSDHAHWFLRLDLWRHDEAFINLQTDVVNGACETQGIHSLKEAAEIIRDRRCLAFDLHNIFSNNDYQQWNWERWWQSTLMASCSE